MESGTGSYCQRQEVIVSSFVNVVNVTKAPALAASASHRLGTLVFLLRLGLTLMPVSRTNGKMKEF